MDLSNTGMDPGHVLLLSWWLTTEFSAVKSVTADSTGNMQNQKPYTLSFDKQTIDLIKMMYTMRVALALITTKQRHSVVRHVDLT